MKDLRQSDQYAAFIRKSGWIVENKNGVYYFVKKFPLIGSFIKIQRPEKLDFKTVNSLAKKYRAFQIVIEPKSKYQVASIKYQGFSQSQSPYLPSKTLQLDLTKSKKILFGQLKKDCRYSIKKNQISNFKFQITEDVENFHSAWRKSVPWNRYVSSVKTLKTLKKAFGKDCLLLIAGLPDEALANAGALFLKTRDIGYYWFAFTNKEGRATLAQYSLLWQGIMWAKKEGCRLFDFEGIYDPRFPNKSWIGFSHFKKGFGGKEKKFPGSYQKWRLPL